MNGYVVSTISMYRRRTRISLWCQNSAPSSNKLLKWPEFLKKSSKSSDATRVADTLVIVFYSVFHVIVRVNQVSLWVLEPPNSIPSMSYFYWSEPVSSSEQSYTASFATAGCLIHRHSRHLSRLDCVAIQTVSFKQTRDIWRTIHKKIYMYTYLVVYNLQCLANTWHSKPRIPQQKSCT